MIWYIRVGSATKTEHLPTCDSIRPLHNDKWYILVSTLNSRTDAPKVNIDQA